MKSQFKSSYGSISSCRNPTGRSVGTPFVGAEEVEEVMVEAAVDGVAVVGSAGVRTVVFGVPAVERMW